MRFADQKYFYQIAVLNKKRTATAKKKGDYWNVVENNLICKFWQSKKYCQNFQSDIENLLSSQVEII